MVTIKTNQHAYFTGRTQSGKSTLVKSLLSGYPRILYHDRKFEHSAFAAQNHYAIMHTPDQVIIGIQKGAKRIIYQPTDASIEDFDMICKIIFYAGNMCFVIDESASYCAHGKIPYFTGELLRLGAGRGISVISLTQRTRDVANVLLSESSIIVAFRLGLLTDRQKIVQSIGTHINHITLGGWRKMINQPVRNDEKPDKAVTVDEVLRTLPKWHYLLYSSDDETITLCAPIPLKR